MLDPQIYAPLITQFGSIKNIPEASLKENGLRRLFDEKSGAQSLVSESEFNRLRSDCYRILNTFRGYIFAHNLDRIHRYLRGKENIDEKLLGMIARRAEAFQEAGIPPIFDPDFLVPNQFEHASLGSDGQETLLKENLFPTVDFIIQYATGAYQRKKAAITIKSKEKIGKRPSTKIAIQPATLRDVQDFRKCAFTPEGKINSLLIKETLQYARDNFEYQSEGSRANLEQFNGLVFLNLEEMLRDVSTDPTSFADWSGDLTVVKEDRWYLNYTPEKALEIAQAFFNSLQRKPTGEERKSFLRMAALFPELALPRANELGIKEIADPSVLASKVIEAATQKQDYSKIPQEYLIEEPYCSQLAPILQSFMRGKLTELIQEDPTCVFVNVGELPSLIKIPRGLGAAPGFKEIFDEVRIEAVSLLTDEEFKRLFTGSEGGASRFAGIGGTRTGRINEAGRRLKNVLAQRYSQVMDGSSGPEPDLPG